MNTDFENLRAVVARLSKVLEMHTKRQADYEIQAIVTEILAHYLTNEL